MFKKLLRRKKAPQAETLKQKLERITRGKSTYVLPEKLKDLDPSYKIMLQELSRR